MSTLPYELGMVRAFLMVYETESVTQAAKLLHLTQPGVSYALKRFREITHDDLFIRQGHRMLPTPHARLLYPRLLESLRGLDAAVAGSLEFSPLTSTRTFRLQLTDVGSSILLPVIIQRMRERAPRLSLEIQQLDLGTAIDELAEARLDGFIASAAILDPRIRRDMLFEQHYVGICRERHPRLGPAPTLEQLLAERHINFSSSTGHVTVEEALREKGLSRAIAITLPSFQPVPLLVRNSDLVSYIPSTLQPTVRALGGLRTFPLPLALGRSTVSLYTRVSKVNAASDNWFRTLIMEAIAPDEDHLLDGIGAPPARGD